MNNKNKRNKDFAAGFSAHRGRHWSKAADLFQEALRLHPADRPSRLYLQRCHAFLEYPPPPTGKVCMSWRTNSRILHPILRVLKLISNTH